MAADAGEKETREADPLKYYCVIFLVIVAALAVMYFKIEGDRKAYIAASASAQRALTVTGARTSAGRPEDLPTLAFEVEQYLTALQEAGGAEAGDSQISFDKMTQLALKAGLNATGTGNPSVEARTGSGYSTTTQRFDYDAASLSQLVTHIYNIEQQTRYRVTSVRWRLRPEKDNATPPFNQIEKFSIEVSVRTGTRN
jgi:hypothetical protein